MMQIGSSGVSRIGTCQHEMMPAALCICLPLVYLLPTFCLRFPHRGSVGARPLDRDLGYRPTPPSWPNLALPRATEVVTVTLWRVAKAAISLVDGAGSRDPHIQSGALRKRCRPLVPGSGAANFWSLDLHRVTDPDHESGLLA
jgi:hypothetical protein